MWQKGDSGFRGPLDTIEESRNATQKTSRFSLKQHFFRDIETRRGNGRLKSALAPRPSAHVADR